MLEKLKDTYKSPLDFHVRRLRGFRWGDLGV